jgi:homoserine dehydrogenase
LIYIILSRKKDLFAKLGFSVTVKKICVRDASKKRDFELPPGAVVVTDPKEILDDDSIQVR